MTAEQRPFLRLVHDRDENGATSEISGHFEPVQAALIGTGLRALFVCTTDSLDKNSFLDLLTTVQPEFALDLRATPRFDFGTLTRKRVLSLFEGLGIRYLDLHLPGEVPGTAMQALDRFSRDPLFSASLPDVKAAESIVLFIDPAPDYRSFGLQSVQSFRQLTQLDWELVLRGPSQEPAPDRQLIFVSHANPEDNEFVLWLHAQLTRQGYDVWADLNNLKGGEVFWDTIEKTIREKAAKVIVVASRTAMSKSGVLDEISLAVSIERAEKLAGFVIPLKIDDLSYLDFRANIARKNAIDFSNSWARGLLMLFDTLRRDQVPKALGTGGGQLAAWWENRKQMKSKVVSRSENLISNQFLVETFPSKMFIFRGTPTTNAINSLKNREQGKPPLIPYQEVWLSFLSASELKTAGFSGLALEKTVAADEVIRGNLSIVQHLKEYERQRLTHRILNRQWEFFLLQKGFLEHGTPQRATVMYVPKGLLEKDQVEFIDDDGVKRRRKLVGYSEKRKVFWHLGLIARFGTESGLLSMKLRLNVVFSEDGGTKLVATERMRDLRRRFCKNWWNDRWRSLQAAAMSSLANGSSCVVLHDGESGPLGISSKSRTFSVPISIDENVATSIELDVEDIDYDQLDDEFDEAVDVEMESDTDGVTAI